MRMIIFCDICSQELVALRDMVESVSLGYWSVPHSSIAVGKKLGRGKSEPGGEEEFAMCIYYSINV